MSIATVAAVTAVPAAPLEAAAAPATIPAPGGFEAMLDGLQRVNADLNASAAATRSLALGQSDNLPQVMMMAEQARIEFELVVQVRNKLLEAYQELMRTQA